MKNLKICFFAFLFFSSLFLYKKVFADTIIDISNSIISTDTIWTKAAGPYLVHDGPIIEPGATLTIEPGTTVNLDQGQYIDVLGKLVANGASSDKIYFTTSATGTYWGGIEILDSGSYEISNAEISYANTALSSESASGSIDSVKISNCNIGIDISGSTANIKNSVLSGISGNALNISFGSTISIDSSSITNIGQYGIQLSSASNLDFNNSSIDGIQANQEATDVRDGSYIKISNSSIKNAGTGIEVYEGSSADFINSSIENITDGYSSAFAVFNDSTFNISSSTADGLYGGYALEAFNNSKLIISDSLLQNFHGYYAFDIFSDNSYATSTLDITNSKINKGDKYGLFIYQGADAHLNNVEITNFWEDGILTYGFPDIQIIDSTFSGNYYGIESYGANIAISNSIIKNNDNYGIYNDGLPITSALNNWWGDASGPFNATLNASGIANQVSDNVDFIPWLTDIPVFSTSSPTSTSTATTTATTTDSTSTPPTSTSTAKIPVLIIPGVLGTEISLQTNSGPEKLWLDLLHNLIDIGDQFMDSLQFNSDLTPSIDGLIVGDIIRKPSILFDYSDGLIKEFQNQGYVEGTDLFVFPYDWRYGISEDNINNLKQKIADILTQTGSEKIDIVAHSTGGLLIKKYAIENPSDNHINKAVFVGVPNTGAPKALKALIEGDNSGIPFLSSGEMKKIARNLPIIYELLPSQRYYDEKGSYIKIINQEFFTSTSTNLNFDEAESFLVNDHNLNLQGISMANALHTIDFDNFDLRSLGINLYAIDGCKAGTFGKLIEVRSTNIFGATSTSYNTPVEIPGDGTVPLESSTNLPINEENKFYALKSDHGKMLSQDGIKQEIVNIISGSALAISSITQDISKCQLNGRAISVYSPVSIDIYDQDNNHSGLTLDGTSTENNIPNADFEIIGDHKFVYLPTDEGQIYTIILKGTDSGIFTITDATILNNEIVGTQVFKDIPVSMDLTGRIDIGATTTLVLKQSSSSSEEILQPSFVLNAQESQNFNPQLPIEQVQPTTSSQQFIRHGKRRVIPSYISTTVVSYNIQSQTNSGQVIDIEKETISDLSSTTLLLSKEIKKSNEKAIKIAQIKKEKHVITISTPKSLNNQVATVLESKHDFGIWNKIKSFIKRLFHIK